MDNDNKDNKIFKRFIMSNENRKIGLKSEEEKEKEFQEEVVEIRRVSRTIAGGRRIRFRAVVVIGDKKGRVGVGVDKANEVLDAVNKAKKKARKSLINVPIINETIPFPIESKFRGARVKLLPASMGTGVIAGGSVRVIMDLAGIKNLLSKTMGSPNKLNNLLACYGALNELSLLSQMKEIAANKESKPKKKRLSKKTKKVKNK